MSTILFNVSQKCLEYRLCNYSNSIIGNLNVNLPIPILLWVSGHIDNFQRMALDKVNCTGKDNSPKTYSYWVAFQICKRYFSNGVSALKFDKKIHIYAFAFARLALWGRVGSGRLSNDGVNRIRTWDPFSTTIHLQVIQEEKV